MARNIHQEIEQTVKTHPVVVYMKGSKVFPQCGFSATVVQILNEVGATYITVDVLADQEIREGIKQYSDWPTVPQLYVRGEFVGGCDIVRDMHSKGELEALLNQAA